MAGPRGCCIANGASKRLPRTSPPPAQCDPSLACHRAACLQQRLHCSHVPRLGSQVQRSHAIGGSGLTPRPGCQQAAQHAAAARQRGPVQRSQPLAVGRVQADGWRGLGRATLLPSLLLPLLLLPRFGRSRGAALHCAPAPQVRLYEQLRGGRLPVDDCAVQGGAPQAAAIGAAQRRGAGRTQQRAQHLDVPPAGSLVQQVLLP